MVTTPRGWLRKRAHARRGLVVAAIIGSGTVLAMLSAGSPATAKPEFMPGFAETYPAAAASPLNSCLLCHTTANPTDASHRRNSYGNDWEERGDKDYRAIETRDSDGDGFSNLTEIQALSFPGDPNSNPNTVTTTTTLAGTAPDGAALYASACAACHGSGGGNLRGTTLTSQQFTNAVTNGRAPSMPAFGASLSSTQIGAIYSYVTGAAPPTTTTTTTTQPGAPPPDGGTLFAGSCAGCHGAGGGNLVPTSLSSEQLVSVITSGRGGMPGFGGSMSAAQIQALADYLLARTAAPTTTTTLQPGVTTTTAAPRSGSAVFSASCASCHGAGGGNLVGSSLSHAQLVSVITSGRGSMPGFANRIPAAEIEAVASYIASLGSSGGVTTTTAAAGTSPNGSALYGQACASCHGSAGQGGAGGPLTGTTLSRSQLVGVIGNGRGSMPSFRTRFNSAEIDALAAFVTGLGSSGGGTTTTAAAGAGSTASTLYMQKCSACHGPHGEGGSGGPLAATGLSRSAILSVVRAGRGAMPSFATTLSSTELGALADYVAVLSAGVTAPAATGTGTGSADGSPGVEDDTTALAGDTTTTATAPTTTTGPSAGQGSGGAGESAAAAPSGPASGRPGSPWVPVAPLLAGVVGVSLGAVRLWWRSLRGISGS